MAAFRLTSTAFSHDQDIPQRHMADGDDASPPMTWEGVPEDTVELALVCEDPDTDAGVVTHWMVYGIPPEVAALPEGLPPQPLVTEPGGHELVQGLNEFDQSGYTGPSWDDERGPHRCFFRLFALDVELDVPPGAQRADLRAAAEGHILAVTELVGIT